MMEMKDENGQSPIRLMKYEPNEGISNCTREELNDSWNKVLKEQDELYTEIPVENVTLSCSIDEFFDTFLRDEADYPFHLFQSDIIGDMDLEISPWRKENVDENDDSSSNCYQLLTRTIKYTHPVSNAPMAPPTARATKEQRLRIFNDGIGLCLDTRTSVTGVPVSDCFHVIDRFVLEPNPATDEVEGSNGSSSSSTLLTIKFDVCFTKKTLFKKIVKMTTGDEMKNFWVDYVSFVNDKMMKHAFISPIDEPSILDNFMASLDEITAPLQELAVPLQELANEVVDDIYEAFTIIPGISTTETCKGTIPEQQQQQPQRLEKMQGRKKENYNPNLELTYLPTIGREIKSLKIEKDRRILIRNALLRQKLISLSRDRLFHGEYVIRSGKLLQEEEKSDDSFHIIDYYNAFRGGKKTTRESDSIVVVTLSSLPSSYNNSNIKTDKKYDKAVNEMLEQQQSIEVMMDHQQYCKKRKMKIPFRLKRLSR